MSVGARRGRRAASALLGGGGGGFTDPTDIGWHSLFWAEGPDFQALGYTDGATLTSWPNETAEVDATSVTGTPFYVASEAALNSQPAVDIIVAEGLQTGTFTSAPSYTSGVSLVAIARIVTTSNAFIADGITSTTRNAMYQANSAPDSWAIYAGASVLGGAKDTNAHLFVGYFDGNVGTDTMTVDGAGNVSGAAGAQTLTGLSIGRHYSSTTLGLAGQISLLGLFEEPAARPAPRPEPTGPGSAAAPWIGALLASDLMASQREIAGPTALPEEEVRRWLELLALHGGRMTLDGLSATLGLPDFRVSERAAALERLLNLEGYAVLERSEQTIRLDRALLATQFGLEE